MKTNTYKIDIFGRVWGVGFRPFVYKLATTLKLLGEVYNSGYGVVIFINATNGKKTEFIKTLKATLPPLARIDDIKTSVVKYKSYESFTISKSINDSAKSPFLPDFGLCDECKKELFKKDDKRRFLYPFITCTNCGPRYSLIKALPYDRCNTTMSDFALCPKCQSEYDDKNDRRFHAEVISCNDCGINIHLKTKQKTILSGLEAIKECAKLILKGKIIAIKSTTGFHLAVNALDENAIKRLRKLKSRPLKPLAVMVKDTTMALKYAHVNQIQKKYLNQIQKPIILLKSRQNLPKNIHFNLKNIGIFLPPNGLYEVLFKYLKTPIVATSANISQNPILKDFDELKEYDFYDYILDNDRKIISQSDDSLMALVDKKPLFLRLSRAYRPDVFKSGFSKKGCFLALGGEQKCEFAIYKDGLIYLSPYIGDIKNEKNLTRLINTIDFFVKTYDFEFDYVLCDKHPHFLHTQYFSSYKRVFIQHHHAHALSVMGEHKLLNAFAFCFDGTGYFDNLHIWGGEVLECSGKDYKRAYHFDEFLLLPNAITNIRLLAFSILLKYNLKDRAKEFLSGFDKNIHIVYNKRLNSVYTSSLGRIFDAFGALVLGCEKNEYDGYVGMQIENFYDKSIKIAYKYEIKNGVISYKDAFLGALRDDKITACSKFINMIVNIVVSLAKTSDKPIVLCGGIFQNLTLLSLINKEFKKLKIKYHEPKNFCQNDSNIAYGQIIYHLRSENV